MVTEKESTRTRSAIDIDAFNDFNDVIAIECNDAIVMHEDREAPRPATPNFQRDHQLQMAPRAEDVAPMPTKSVNDFDALSYANNANDIGALSYANTANDIDALSYVAAHEEIDLDELEAERTHKSELSPGVSGRMTRCRCFPGRLSRGTRCS
jgi:hypothetical protein